MNIVPCTALDSRLQTSQIPEDPEIQKSGLQLRLPGCILSQIIRIWNKPSFTRSILNL
jgi:hypothetical protein